MKTLALFASLFLASLYAQDIHVGVKGGVPLTHGVTPGSIDESKRYTVGPTFEVGLGHGLSIEVDALYKRLGYSQTYSFVGENALRRGRGNSWEFPMLAKYTFGHRESQIRPYVALGGNLRKIWSDLDFASVGTPTNLIGALPRSFSFVSDLQAGGTAAGGVLFQRGRFGIAPEFRYTRWATTNFQTNRNQAEILVGIRF